MRLAVFRRLLAISICHLTLTAAAVAEESIAPNADLAIRGPLLDSEIVIKTTARTAGAIDSLSWRGKEFIDSFDHGRQLQSASNFDFAGKFHGETFNPTEAGSVADGAGQRSTSRLLHSLASENRLQTTTQMAFWLRPDGNSRGNPATNLTVLSNHLLTKRITIGYRGRPEIIEYDVTFHTPLGERHTYAQFEAVTGYMPAEFSQFWRFRWVDNEPTLLPLDDGPGEQSDPVVLSTPDGQFAMGVFSPEQPAAGFEHAGYGRFRFAPQRVVKWNCVFRVRNRDGIEPGDYRYRSYVVVGTRDMVQESLAWLSRAF